MYGPLNLLESASFLLSFVIFRRLIYLSQRLLVTVKIFSPLFVDLFLQRLLPACYGSCVITHLIQVFYAYLKNRFGKDFDQEKRKQFRLHYKFL